MIIAYIIIIYATEIEKTDIKAALKSRKSYQVWLSNNLQAKLLDFVTFPPKTNRTAIQV